MADETLSNILEAISEQTHINNQNGLIIRQYLSSFIISNTHLGPKSIQSLEKLVSHMLELTINNV